MQHNILLRYASLFLFILCTHAFAITSTLVTKGNITANQWSLMKPITDSTMSGIIQLDNALLAVGSNLTENKEMIGVFKSLDKGESWKNISVPKMEGILKNASAIGNHVVAVGENSIVLLSDDGGETFAKISSLPSVVLSNKVLFNSIANNGKTFLAAGTYTFNEYFTRNVLMRSDDYGKTWQSMDNILPIFPIKGYINDIVWDGEKWIAVGTYEESFNKKGFVITSNNLSNWTMQNLPDNATKPSNIIAKDNHWTIWTNDVYHNLLKSDDQGKNWSLYQSILPYDYENLNFKLRWNGSVWMLVGSKYVNSLHSDTDPVIFTSNDGIKDWTEQVLPKDIFTHMQTKAAFNDALWNGTHWIAVGRYAIPASGCKSYEGKFIGTLVSGPYVINVSNLGLSMIGRKYQSDEFNVGSGSIEYTNGQGQFGYGLGGTCKEDNGIATLDVNNNMSSARLIAQKSMDGNQIQVTQSALSLDGGKTYLNFTGTLIRSNGQKH